MNRQTISQTESQLSYLMRSASSSAFICFCRRYRSRGDKYWYRFRLDSFCSSSIFNVLLLKFHSRISTKVV